MMVVFTIPGEPQGKARGRTFIHKHTGRPTTMTPEKTVNYEALIKLQAGQSTKEFYQDQELFMRLTAYYSIPKSASKKKAELMRNIEIRPTKKPDIDNIIKVVCDALNGVVYKDDTQIVSISAQKFYENIPRVEVCIFTKEEVRKGKWIKVNINNCNVIFEDYGHSEEEYIQFARDIERSRVK